MLQFIPQMVEADHGDLKFENSLDIVKISQWIGTFQNSLWAKQRRSDSFL